MYSLQATLREITVEVMTIQEITVEVVDLPLFLDMTADMLPPPPEVVYLDLDLEIDPFPDLSPAQLGLHLTHL